MKNKKLKRTVVLSLCGTFSLILSYLETLIPPIWSAVPGIKIGLANIAVIFALYKFGIKEAVTVSLIRIFLVAMLFASPISMIYSLAGGILSIIGMSLLKRFTPLNEITVSVCGGVLHNVGQITMASIMLSTNVVTYYLPFLMISGIIAGIAVGVAAGVLIKRIPI